MLVTASFEIGKGLVLKAKREIEFPTASAKGDTLLITSSWNLFGEVLTLEAEFVSDGRNWVAIDGRLE